MSRLLVGCILVLGLLNTIAGCAAVTAGAPLTAETSLTRQLDQLLDDPLVAEGHWGIVARSLETGETLYSRNADRLFVPASNMKLLTAAAALEMLGPDYRYRTTIATSGEIRDGTLDGALLVIGSGDPTFSGRFLDDPRDAFRAWADSLRAHGITRIRGPIIGVDTAFIDAPLGAGWAWDDLTEGYAAEFGALQFNEGTVQVDVFPSSTPLAPALLVLTPPTQGVRIINNTRTVLPGSLTALRVLRDELGTGVVLRGEVASDSEGTTRTVAVPDPARFFVTALREALRERGILAEGPAVAQNALDPFDPFLQNWTPLFTNVSVGLSAILPVMLKTSQNQMAEMLLRTVGREVRGTASAEGGALVVDSLLAAWGIGGPARIADGSGLSRYNLVSPTLIAGVLEHMDRGQDREVWISSLAVAGQDGTLAMRMRDAPLFGQVQAKTGTLSGVSALSGYLTTPRGERIVFSTILNHYIAPSSDAEHVAEAALEMISTAR